MAEEVDAAVVVTVVHQDHPLPTAEMAAAVADATATHLPDLLQEITAR